MTRAALIFLLFTALVSASGCVSDRPEPSNEAADHEAPAPTNRIDVPPAVRQNLGITFATVERRPVRETIRLPGEFELRPDALREYRAMIPGRVSLNVTQFDNVTPETLLFTIDSPQWRELQHETVEAAGEIKLAEAALNVAVATQVESQQAAAFLKERLARLTEAQTRNVELEAELGLIENRLPRLTAEINAREVDLVEAEEHYRSRLRTLASVTGMSVESLMEPVNDAPASAALVEPDAPRWATLEHISFYAGFTGVVTAIQVTDGGWVETGGLVMTAANPIAIRFRAHALQSDMERLRDGLPAIIVPPRGSSLAFQNTVEATLSVGFEGVPGERTIPVYAVPAQITSWSRPGVSAFLEVFTNGSADGELAIPTSALVRDGLRAVFFRRDPGNPNQVIRMDADLGTSDGRWVVVKSGVKAGDEVVLDGAYQLMLASSSGGEKGGHFHADGTFHEDDHE
jgi:hypothetical protein